MYSIGEKPGKGTYEPTFRTSRKHFLRISEGGLLTVAR